MIPLRTWLQVHSSIRFGQFIAHESTHNPASFSLINQRFEDIYGDQFSFHSSDMLITVCWMILARSYEIVDSELEGSEKNKFYLGLSKEALDQCNLSSFSDFKTSYELTIQEFPDDGHQFHITLWKFVKVIRDAISHVDYEFDNCAGTLANQTIVNFHHEYRGNCRLKMTVPFDKLFLMIEHLGVWIDCSIQSNNLIRS